MFVDLFVKQNISVRVCVCVNLCVNYVRQSSHHHRRRYISVLLFNYMRNEWGRKRREKKGEKSKWVSERVKNEEWIDGRTNSKYYNNNKNLKKNWNIFFHHPCVFVLKKLKNKINIFIRFQCSFSRLFFITNSN